jgi:glucose-1-phosphate thymidylyltransferase
LSQAFKIVIPMAGWATRLRPHTWSKPKPLVSVAGKTALEHTLDMFKTLPETKDAEYVFIVDPLMGKIQISEHLDANYPDLRVHFAVQSEMKGQSHALWMAKEHLSGPTIMVFSDTLIKTDFSFLDHETSDGVAWVKPVEDPRRFGVAELNGNGYINRLIEKPDTMENNLALVGCYYFKQGEDLAAAIGEQIDKDINIHGEYYLTDALNLMISKGAQMRTEQVNVWLDTGTIDAALETNAYMLAHGSANGETYQRPGVKIVHPVYIHPNAEISQSVIGPHASIGPDCKINDSEIKNSIIEAGTQIVGASLDGSFIGCNCQVEGQRCDEAAALNIGDNSTVKM